eukprot:NODE_911_length_1696_cov_18.058895_g744_i0.p1 GENE.NODE_911_length_1696_cov_18.058895_g744_i0~~NODE_911_length_1696_cov_18.058895_g744_i0.p1  ORF type:complete len:533 (+),score=123.81 NODE_911_length_1696_cov_18.058895_g744_i0:159-1601(+)
MQRPQEVKCWQGGPPPKLYQKEKDDLTDADYSDVCQGRVGNCWFMSAMASVSAAGRISDVIRRVDDAKGVYEVRLWRTVDSSDNADDDTVTLQPLYVCVDNRIPMVSSLDTPPFCYSDEKGELWPSILEKAFAKAIDIREGKRSYSAMDGGLFAIGVLHLVGGLSRLFKPNKEPPFADTWKADALGAELKERASRGHIVGVSFKPLEGGAKVGPMGELEGYKGLVTGHAYSLLNLAEVPYNGRQQLLAQMRNPWGENGAKDENLEWKGDWSDHSSLWKSNPAAQKACDMDVPKKDGCFWMAIEDLAQWCESFTACVPPTADICENDYTDEDARRCARCQVCITGAVMRALDKAWHQACLTCIFCDKKLGTSFVKIPAEGFTRPAHPECAKDAQAKLEEAENDDANLLEYAVWKPSSPPSKPGPPPVSFKKGVMKEAARIQRRKDQAAEAHLTSGNPLSPKQGSSMVPPDEAQSKACCVLQ